MHVEEFNCIDQLGSLRDVWSDLLKTTPSASFFQSLDWLEVYWRHFGANQRLRVLAAFDGGQIFGILPMVVRREATKVGTLRFLTYPLEYWGSFYGPIGSRPLDTLRAGLEYLRSVQSDWDVLELRWVGADEDETAQTAQVMQDVGLGALRSKLDSTAVVRINGPWSDYLAGKTSKWRNNSRRWRKRLEESGEVRYLRYRPGEDDDGDPRWDLFDQCVQIARASWQGESQTGTTLSHESVYQFLRETHEVAARKGGLDLNLLYLDNRPVAYAYNYFYRGYVCGLRVGFDASLSRDGAGNLLYARALEDSFCRGDWLYDMGPGSLGCKRLWWTEVLPVYRLSHFRTFSVRQQLLRAKRVLDNRADGREPAAQMAAASPRP